MWPYLSFVCLCYYLAQDTSATLFLWLQTWLQNCTQVLGGSTHHLAPPETLCSAQGRPQALGKAKRAAPKREASSSTCFTLGRGMSRACPQMPAAQA